MSENKFSKFAIRYLTRSKTIVYAYSALDEVNDCVLSIRVGGDFGVQIPATIHGTCGANFAGEPDCMEEITEEQFWKVYKSYTLALFKYHQDQTAVLV